eukprot:CAMPEP_0168606802 /NCGR_PEP_ID=MMETSP0420-20121227/16786_1 /TAXON_ID=498008 /ORGANISM="Pessonella sp." /LENGTH=347 /DNA_ID=CAMNT_0008646533 /DNA_START=205 /DNA_END=1244 /DNA_ORIENTATION=+
MAVPIPAAENNTDSPTSSGDELSGDEITAIIVFCVCWVVLVVFIYIVFKSTVKLVRHAEVMIVERWGKYRTTLKPGLHFLIPFVDKPRKVHWRYVQASADHHHINVKTSQTDRIDMREVVIDFGRQHVITKDTVSIDIDALVYYQITDPELAVFKIQNLPDAVELLTQTTLRNIIAQMTLDDTFSSRELINSQLKEKTILDAERWGITIKHVEIMNILPPSDIKRVMEEQIREERERRSTVITADGTRESAVIRSQGTRAEIVLSAEGEKTSNIQLAKGQAEARLLVARAEAAAIAALRTALQQGGARARATDYLVALRYIQRLKEAGDYKKTNLTLLPSASLDALG